LALDRSAPAKPRPGEPRVMQVRLLEIGAGEVGIGEVAPLEIFAGQIAARTRTRAAGEASSHRTDRADANLA
jgi:hypothetical protein